MSVKLLVLLSLILSACEGCDDRLSCSDCLSVKGCGWCIANTTGYCISENDDRTVCMAVVNPRSKVYNEVTRPLNDVYQVSLDSINLRLRVGEPLTFNFTVKPAENFPLDLYILMDLSNSYKEDLVIVKQLAPTLANSLNNLTDDALIGFGTFIDKLTEPYFSEKHINLGFKDKNDNPSCIRDEECSFPVAFEHVSNLTNSSDDFNNALQMVSISTNADIPEGALDGMMQATVCTDLIGWRDNSRKVLIVMTDAIVHTAGDGRLGGIVKINDETCHTQYSKEHDRFLYTASTEYDYPSLEQLRLVLRRYGIVPVFAVPSAEFDYFNMTAGLLNGLVAETADDSSDLLIVVAEAYNDIVSQVTVDYDSPNFLTTEVSLACPIEDDIVYSSEMCNDIESNSVQVNITLTLSECSKEVTNGKMYPLEVAIPGFDRFTIFIEGECNCDCETANEIDESRCLNGELNCGKCDCENGYMGDRCDCSTDLCPSFNGIECGGRGSCDGCGSCICNTIDSPQYSVSNPQIFEDSCQCSNYECETDLNGLACSGRGNCVCDNGVFSCECGVSSNTGEAHYGDICQCSSDHCVDPDNPMNITCSGHGTCRPCEAQGSACSCTQNYRGEYCGTFIDLNTDNCGSADESCIECYGTAADNKQDVDVACSNCAGYILLDDTQSSSYEIPGTVNGSTDVCTHSTTECSYNYYVGISLSSDMLYAVEPRSCLLIPIWAIAVIILVGLLIIGIIVIVIIKLCLMWLDYREYKRFMYDVNSANKSTQSNPVYQNPITHVDNPIHGKPV